MKKVFLVFAAILVLFTVNSPALADDDDIPSAIRGVNNIRLLKTDSECRKIGGLMLPSDAERNVLEVDIVKVALKLPPGAYWLFGKGEDFQIITLRGLGFLSISRGFYVLYYKAPEESFPAMEVVRPATLRQL